MKLSILALVAVAVNASPIEKRQTCVNGSYGCSGQNLQQCSYVDSSNLGWITITGCSAGTVCSVAGFIGCVPGSAPAPPTTAATTAAAVKPTTSASTTTAAPKATTQASTQASIPATTQASTTAAQVQTTIKPPSTTATAGTPTTPSGLPACFIGWSSTVAYTVNSQVSVSNINYQAKWYEGVGASPVTNADGGWASQGPCNPGLPVPPNPSGPAPVATTLAQAQAYAASLSTDPILQMLKTQVRTNFNIDSISPGNPSNPDNVKRVESIVTPFKWNVTYFSMADPVYTYTNFLKSVGFFAGFCDTYAGRDSDTICKRLLSTMFAHFAQETGAHSRLVPIAEWQQSLVYVRELTCTETNSSPGCNYNNDCTNPAFNTVFPCAPGPYNGFLQYFGRGAHQLSYSFNYGPFSEVIYGNPTVLLNTPSLVADTWLNLASAIFFFLYPQPPKPSMLGVMDGTWVPNAADIAAGRSNDFPSTIQIINGECAGSSLSSAASNRISYYKSFAADMGLDTSKENFNCANMPAFDTSSSAAKTNMYWVGSYLTAGQCQLVPYQTNFNALMDGPTYKQYALCVNKTFNVTLA
ncbi:hypothetical protein HDU98_009035 [Podochytrium sp. JEL0797]|nr:hypothetical protein HDU98_009035 [Podochytrium sp. JEL0797]